ncbi:MAG: hypothetical protein GDA36_08585, partial [Rhodobacteraceae bacterium]|nr:hypothetical protein [Paracoccaceae bacterium]
MLPAEEESPTISNNNNNNNNNNGCTKVHNSSADWLRDLQRRHHSLPEQGDVNILPNDVLLRVKRMSNWKCPGLDLVPVFWLKKLTALHCRLANQFQDLLQTQALSNYVLLHSDQPLLRAVQCSGLFQQPECSLSDFKSKWLQDYMQQWKGKPLHGQFPSQVEALTIVDCAYKWLRVSGLKIETEALLC